MDISELGLGVELAGDLVPGELVGLCFRLPGNDVDLTPLATVRRRLDSHYGFEFVSIERPRWRNSASPARSCPASAFPSRL